MLMKLTPRGMVIKRHLFRIFILSRECAIFEKTLLKKYGSNCEQEVCFEICSRHSSLSCLRSSTLKKENSQHKALKSAFKSDAELTLHLKVFLKGLRRLC